MTNGITATVSVRVTASDSVAPPVGGATHQINQSFLGALIAGNGGLGKSDRMITKAINIAASGSVSINLTTADDAFGEAIAMTEVQAVYLEADATNANNIVFGNGTDPWVGPFDAGTDTVAVKPGGALLLFDPLGYPVVASTGDQVKLTNSGSGTAVTGVLVIIGRSA